MKQQSKVAASQCLQRRTAGGFSLVEVMAALVITAVGLLGIAKMQALAYSATGISSKRSLVAIEAGSLAATMRANRAYWISGIPAAAPITVSGTTISDATLNGTTNDCTAASCTPAQLAAYDLHRWANAINALLANSSPATTITCANNPVNCVIAVTWSEKTVALNNRQSANAMQTSRCNNMVGNGPSYCLYVEP